MTEQLCIDLVGNDFTRHFPFGQLVGIDEIAQLPNRLLILHAKVLAYRLPDASLA